jgi:flagellar biosynthetic protein FliQ
MLTEAIFFDTVRMGLWIATVTAVPILSAALIAGVGVGLFQALTSIQEMTLTFVPKLLAIVAVFWMSMSFMTRMLVEFFQDHLIPIIIGG